MTTADPVLISALNDYLYCARRAALKFIEGLRETNAFTIEGSLAHEHADTPGVEARPGVRIVRALPLFSERLGLVGKADVVEFHRQPGGGEVPEPIEYKRGKLRRWNNDDVQVCAQGLCLEEMVGVAVPAGAVYHAASRHRREIPFTGDLRRQTEETVAQVRALVAGGVIPPAVLVPQCDGCSLRGVCLPEVSKDAQTVRDYMADLTRDL